MAVKTQFEYRAMHPVARALINHLLVPDIYLSKPWPDEASRAVDIVAIDRAGSGDVHIVEIKQRFPEDLRRIVARLREIPAHYRWLAFRRPVRGVGLVDLDRPELYATKGAGRVGLIEVVTMDVAMARNALGANIILSAERFHEAISDLADEFVSRTTPDIKFS